MKNRLPLAGAPQSFRSSSAKSTGPSVRFRLPLLLYSYIANELLAPFFASFLILYGVFFLIRLIPLLDVVLALRIGTGDFVRLFSYIFPHMLLYVIPMSSMAGVIIGFTRLTNDREILALKACGVSLRQMLPPVLLIAAAIACLTGFFSVRLIPAGALGVKQLMFQLAKEKIDKGLKEKEFTEALGDIVVYVDSIDNQQNWHGVYVSDMRGRTQPLITVAKSGRMAAEMERMQVNITLEDGSLHNADGPDNQVIRFKRYQLQISLRPPTKVGGEDVTTLGRGTMNQQQLLDTAQKQGLDTRPGRMLLSEYHYRLVLPVGCFILSLLGMPLGLQAKAGKRAIGLPLGLAFFILYYITFTTGRVLSESGALPMVFGMWLPNLLFLLLTAFIFRRTDQERPLIPEPLQDLVITGFNRFLRPIYDRMLTLSRRLLTRNGLRQLTSAASGQDQERRLPVQADGTTGIFHLSNCKQYHCPRCRIKFKNAAVAEAAGFSPCAFCRETLTQPDRRATSPK